MKRLCFFTACTLAILTFWTACSDDTTEEAPTLKVSLSDTEALPYQGGGNLRIAVETNTAWSASRPQEDDWYTLTPTSGEGSAAIEVKVDANTANDSRKSTVTISAGTLQELVVISQLGRSSEPPAAAGTIEGKDEGAMGETVVLTIAPIEGATSYTWYKDGNEVQTSEDRTLNVTETGTYKVAGVNISGTGTFSPDKTVTINTSKFVFTQAEATYEGGDYENAYHVRLSIPTGAKTELGLRLIFCEEKPAGVDDPTISTIKLPARTYLVTQPLYNDYSAVGIVRPSTRYGLDKSYFYGKEDGQYVENQYLYLCETGGFPANKDNWTYDFAEIKVEYDPSSGNYTISGKVPCFTYKDNVETAAGEYEFRYEGPLSFKNNWREYNKFYYTGDDLDGDLDLTGQITGTTTLRYAGKLSETTGEGHYWHLELWQNPMEQVGWDIIMDFYTPAENGAAAPYGTYTVAETPRAGVPMTVDRGYYLKPNYSGLKCQRWNPTGGVTGTGAYEVHVLAQPNKQSYVKLSDNGSGGYAVEAVMFDSKGHKITATYNGKIEIENQTAKSSSASSKCRDLRR